MQIELDLQNAIDSKQLPSFENMQNWIIAALEKVDAKFDRPEITIRIVSQQESQQLNLEYRGKGKPTNVLSFPFEAPEMIPLEALGEFLGDLVICEQVLEQEAQEQKKTVQSHWAHLIIHGVLHLLGFDHIEEHQAEEMEALEIEVMKELGFEDPY
jgi:probable rRNA maturation factor